MLIVPGYTFTDNLEDDGSAEHFAFFLASCAITGIELTKFSTSAHLVQVSATPPVTDQGAGSLWFDTSTNLFRVLNDDRWDCAYEGPDLEMTSAGTSDAGSLVVMDGPGAMKLCTTGACGEVIGILTDDVANGDRAIVKQNGLVNILIRGQCEYGSVLVSDSALPGYARAAGAVPLVLFTGGIEVGMALGAVGPGATGLITCMAWR